MSSPERINRDVLQGLVERPLSREEQDAIDLWEKGRALQQQKMLPGWEVVLEMFQDYIKNAVRDLVETPPTDEATVKAQHAVAFTLNKLVANFIEDVDRAIEATKAPPEVLKARLKIAAAGE